MERRVEMRSTAYCLRGTMRTGVRVRDGMAAGDPNVLPLSSIVRNRRSAAPARIAKRAADGQTVRMN
ncbi:MAG: hypothetical protein KY444_01820, partial [Gemmatimonadetes bacterium]|nr:hypothetical protein [Gemmatimonadota bacterium]